MRLLHSSPSSTMVIQYGHNANGQAEMFQLPFSPISTINWQWDNSLSPYLNVLNFYCLISFALNYFLNGFQILFQPSDHHQQHAKVFPIKTPQLQTTWIPHWQATIIRLPRHLCWHPSMEVSTRIAVLVQPYHNVNSTQPIIRMETLATTRWHRPMLHVVPCRPAPGV